MNTTLMVKQRKIEEIKKMDITPSEKIRLLTNERILKVRSGCFSCRGRGLSVKRLVNQTISYEIHQLQLEIEREKSKI